MIDETRSARIALDVAENFAGFGDFAGVRHRGRGQRPDDDAGLAAVGAPG